MRKKLFIGLFFAAIVGLIAGEYLFNRGGAQDAPKKAEPDEKKTDGNLFDILKKDLDAKKDVPQVDKLPPLHPPPLPQPTVDAKDVIPPPLVLPKPDVVVLTPPKGDEPKAIAPPVIINQPPLPPTVTDKPQTAEPKPNAPPPPVSPPPQHTQPKDIPPTWPPVQNVTPPPALNPPKEPSVKPAVDKDVFPQRKSDPFPPLEGSTQPLPAAPVSPMQPIVDQVAKLKNCPWSLQVEMVDGQAIVTATVNRKHEFKIVCQSLDLQTGKGILKASGKVQINGDALNGACEHLVIPLMEDRLVLEGGAEVRIQKASTNVSDAKPAAFELKGETLNLRISELESSKLLQASWLPSPRDPLVVADKTLASSSGAGKWSPYGILEREENKLGSFWRLTSSSGKSIIFVTHEGKSMDQFVGRTISVYATMEQIDGRPMLRVTHVALP